VRPQREDSLDGLVAEFERDPLALVADGRLVLMRPPA